MQLDIVLNDNISTFLLPAEGASANSLEIYISTYNGFRLFKCFALTATLQ